MAKLDGESAPVRGDEYDAHVAGCEECREVIAGMTRLHARLDALDYDGAASDLWPAVQSGILRRRRLGARERVAFGVLATLVLVWRTAQLVFDVPVPIFNALAPLAVAILIGWWVAGDPLAIQSVVLEEQQERA
jgi:hypothetical protein